MSVLVVPTGSANLASVRAAFAREGVETLLSRDADAIRDARAVVLPGVGHFAAAMGSLRSDGLDNALRDRMLAERPSLAICLGFQLLCTDSEEAPGVEGLGVIDGSIRRFKDDVRCPHLGWTKVSADAGCRLLEDGWGCFAHSYRLETVPDGWRGATAEHGGSFVAAVERGAVLACQLHPELSGTWGAALLRRWLDIAGVTRGRSTTAEVA